MFEKLKRRSLRKRIEKNLTNRDLSQRNTKLRTLGYLVDEDMFQDFELLYDFSAELGLQRKDVKIYSFKEVKKKIPTMRQNQINNKDFSWSGEINNQNALEFLEIQFDVLVGFYCGKNEFMDIMISISKAKFKMGFEGSDTRLFDLILSVDPKDFKSFKEEFKKYLSVLKKI
jgi:hypothetical protein